MPLTVINCLIIEYKNKNWKELNNFRLDENTLFFVECLYQENKGEWKWETHLQGRNLHIVTKANRARKNSPCHHCALTLDRETVVDCHKEVSWGVSWWQVSLRLQDLKKKIKAAPCLGEKSWQQHSRRQASRWLIEQACNFTDFRHLPMSLELTNVKLTVRAIEGLHT